MQREDHRAFEVTYTKEISEAHSTQGRLDTGILNTKFTTSNFAQAAYMHRDPLNCDLKVWSTLFLLFFYCLPGSILTMF